MGCHTSKSSANQQQNQSLNLEQIYKEEQEIINQMMLIMNRENNGKRNRNQVRMFEYQLSSLANKLGIKKSESSYDLDELYNEQDIKNVQVNSDEMQTCDSSVRKLVNSHCFPKLKSNNCLASN